MKKKDYHMLRAWLYGACALFILSIPLWLEIIKDGLSIAFLLIMPAILGYLSYKHFKLSKESNEEDKAYEPPADATLSEKIKFYKKYIWISIIAHPILALIIILDLNDLESGTVQRVELWAPVSFVYKNFGYWPAVLSVPFLGLVVILLFLRKIRLIKSGNE